MTGNYLMSARCTLCDWFDVEISDDPTASRERLQVSYKAHQDGTCLMKLMRRLFEGVSP